MANTRIILAFILTSVSILSCCSSDTDTIHQGQPLKDWDQLTSSNKVFILKFFSTGSSHNRYLGIFYKTDMVTGHKTMGFFPTIDEYPNDKPVWVANRNEPIPDTSGNLMIDDHGKLSMSYSGGSIIVLFNPGPIKTNTSAQLLDSGNLVLQELHPNGSVKKVLWQSFDFPTDTLIPGMKLGIDLKTGHKWSLTSWASSVLPASGSVTLAGDPNGTDQLVMLVQGNIHWTSGPWQNGQFINLVPFDKGQGLHSSYVLNETDNYFSYSKVAHDIFSAITLSPEAQLIFASGNNSGHLNELLVYCTAKGLYNQLGCVAFDYQDLECRKNYGYFTKKRGHLQGIVYMHEYEYDKSYNLTLHDCQQICWKNCYCTAFTYATPTRTGCMIYDKAFDILEAYDEGATDFYILQ